MASCTTTRRACCGGSPGSCTSAIGRAVRRASGCSRASPRSPPRPGNRALGQRLREELEATGPAMAMPLEAVFGLEPLVGQLEPRAPRRLRQLDGDHGLVAARAVLLPGPGEDQALRRQDFAVHAAHD